MLAEFPALCASSLGRDPVGKDRRQDAGAGSDRTDHDQHQHKIRCPRYEEQSNCQHGECGCDEPAGRVRLEPGRECNCLHHKHDQAALGEHQCNLIWTQTEFLFTTQCEPDLEDPDPNRNDESEDEEFWHEPCFFDRPRTSILGRANATPLVTRMASNAVAASGIATDPTGFKPFVTRAMSGWSTPQSGVRTITRPRQSRVYSCIF